MISSFLRLNCCFVLFAWTTGTTTYAFAPINFVAFGRQSSSTSNCHLVSSESQLHQQQYYQRKSNQQSFASCCSLQRHEQQHPLYSSSSSNHVDPPNGINLVTPTPPNTNLPQRSSSSSRTVRDTMRRMTGFSLTALRTALRTATGWSLTALYASTVAATGAWLRWIVKTILAPFPPWMRYFVQPFLVMYYAPLFVLRNVTGPNTRRRAQQTHEKVLEGWKQAVAQADQTSTYWPIHVHEDDSLTTTIPHLINDDVNDDLDVADAIIHQHRRAAGTELCFDTDMAELDVTEALAQSVDVALEAQEQQKQQQKQHRKHKQHAQIPSSSLDEQY